MVPLQKRPGTTITLLLFGIWTLFNQGKMTALGLFGGAPGLMFTSPTASNVIGGLLVHGIVLCICAVAGFGIGRVVERLRKR